MKVFKKGITKDGVKIQLEDWKENYNFMPYGRTIGAYPISKLNYNKPFAPRKNETYRFAFDFDTYEEAKKAFNQLIEGNKKLIDFKDKLYNKEYMDCL